MLYEYNAPDYGVKTNDSYGRHTVGYRPHTFDVFRYIGHAIGVHPYHLADDYVGKHRTRNWGVEK